MAGSKVIAAGLVITSTLTASSSTSKVKSEGIKWDQKAETNSDNNLAVFYAKFNVFVLPKSHIFELSTFSKKALGGRSPFFY